MKREEELGWGDCKVIFCVHRRPVMSGARAMAVSTAWKKKQHPDTITPRSQHESGRRRQIGRVTWVAG